MKLDRLDQHPVIKLPANTNGWTATGDTTKVGFNNNVYALACNVSKNLYAGGFFTASTGGTAMNYVAIYS